MEALESGSESELPLRCRRSNIYLTNSTFFIAVGTLMTAMPYIPAFWQNSRPPDLFLICISWFVGLGSIWFGAWFLFQRTCAEIIAGEMLRWRAIGYGWQEVPWSDVSDYRILPSIYSSQHGGYIRGYEVVTPKRTFQFDAEWLHCEALAERIRRRATSAQVIDWEIAGTRPFDEWPRTFGYWKPIWGVFAIACLLLTLIAAAAFILWAISYVKSLVDLIGWAESRAVVVGLGIVLAVLLALPGRFLLFWFQAWRRQGEHISVTTSEFRYTNRERGESITIPWTAVTDYFYRSKRGGLSGQFLIVLQGADEKQLGWDDTLVGAAQLPAIVQRYAPRPANSRADDPAWRVSQPGEVTGRSDASTWRSGAVGVGDRVFTFRSGNALLGLGSMSVYVCFMLAGIVQAVCTGVRNAAFLFWMVSPLALGTVIGWVALVRCRVETDDLGITSQGILRKKRLYWFAVEDYGEKITAGRRGSKSPSSLWVLGKDGARFNVDSQINGYRSLKDEIERLAPPPRTGWAAASEAKSYSNGRPKSSAK